MVGELEKSEVENLNSTLNMICSIGNNPIFSRRTLRRGVVNNVLDDMDIELKKEENINELIGNELLIKVHNDGDADREYVFKTRVPG
jgi:hypothetical protein